MLLMERHINKKSRMASGKNHMKGPKKRTETDNTVFRNSFIKLITTAKNEGEKKNDLPD
jgi:hypothetical protein